MLHSLTSFRLWFLQKQCERFKRDRDSFKQLLEGAKKTIKELRSNSGRVSKGSMNSGDEDDKSKIMVLEQKVILRRELCGRGTGADRFCSFIADGNIGRWIVRGAAGSEQIKDGTCVRENGFRNQNIGNAIADKWIRRGTAAGQRSHQDAGHENEIGIVVAERAWGSSTAAARDLDPRPRFASNVVRSGTWTW